MSKLGKWSTTPGSNNATPPDGWPEGQAPSTVNDCAREMMASIRTAFNDLQYIDQDFTPTYVNATNFTVASNQTSAIHAGRRLKLFDYTTNYATVVTASFTAVTTITIAADSGSLTASLSSFGISVLSNTNNALPRATSASYESVTISGTLTASGAVICKTTLSVGSDAIINGSLKCLGSISSYDVVAAPNLPKAFYMGLEGAANVTLMDNYGCTATRSALGVVKITFTTPMTSVNYLSQVVVYAGGSIACPSDLNHTSATCKFKVRNAGGSLVDDWYFSAVFYKT